MQQSVSLKDRIVLFLISRLGALFILLLGKTWRLRVIGWENVRQVWDQGGNVIYAFWHGRMLTLCYSHRRQNIHIMVSEHRDGEMIAQTVSRLGFVPVRGSTSRGGLRALFKIAERASSGYDVGITPDGPKGPCCSIQPGVMILAQRTEMPIIPLTNAASFKKNLSSWDSYLIPLPFSRVVVQMGAPIYISRNLSKEDLEKKRLEVERTLNDLTRQADLSFGSPP